jgi:hypothetical protein
MKFYNFVMFLLTCFCIGIIVFGLTGCAIEFTNLKIKEQNEIETEYRKLIRESDK